MDELLRSKELDIIKKMFDKQQQRNTSMYKIEKGLWQGGRIMDSYPKEIEAVVTLDTQPPDHQLGIMDAWIPIDDAGFPGIDWLKMAVNIVRTFRFAGKTVYIHCHAGISRSAMVTAAYLMAKHNWGWIKALEVIAAANPRANPNPHFIKGLGQWEKHLKSIK